MIKRSMTTTEERSTERKKIRAGGPPHYTLTRQNRANIALTSNKNQYGQNGQL